MSLSVAFAALLAGVIVWALLVRKLTTKSWEIQGAPSEIDVVGVSSLPPARVGLWVFLGVVTSLFGLFVSAYYMRMGHGHVQDLGDWKSVQDPPILWFNTAVLILGSVAMQSARRAATQERKELARPALIAGGLLTLVFLAGQLIAWRQLDASGFFVASNPAVAFFYVLTAVHGLHLLGGLFVWGRTVVRMWRPGVELIDVRLSIELCTVYWHYLLLVWIALFALLLST